MIHNTTRIYLDYAATAPLLPCVRERMMQLMSDAKVGNPSSVHTEGRHARCFLEDARQALLDRVPFQENCTVIWTSGGTEANHTVFQGLKHHVRGIIGSAVEHPSVGFWIDPERTIPVTAEGVVRLDVLERVLAHHEAPVLVSIQWVNSETGVIQPIDCIGELVHRYDGIFHVDAVQGLGKLFFPCLDYVDAMTLSAHKIGGPMGVGALIIRDGLSVKPLLDGGSQENRLRAGTPNLLGVVGFEAALRAIDMTQVSPWYEWRARLEEAFLAHMPEVRIYGHSVSRVPHIIALRTPGMDHQLQLIHYDLKGFAISAGSACTSGKVGPSHVLKAMGVPEDAARQTIRISWGWNTSYADLDAFQQAWLS